jgi:hypothetical protein
MGLDTKTYWLTDRQSQCDFDSDLSSELTVAGPEGREHRRWGSYDVGSRYQATTGEHTADWGHLVHAVVNCRVDELSTAL